MVGNTLKNEFSIQPDEAHYQFVKTINVAGVFAIPDRAGILAFLEPGMRLRFVREPENQYDENAIRIDYSFLYESKIGYVPRVDAVHFAPEVDNGTFYVGWIKSLERSNNKILVDVYKRLQFPITGISSIQFHKGGYFGPNIFVKISARNRSLVYQKQEIPFGKTFQQVLFHFTKEQWNDFVAPALQASNFLAWLDEYVDPAVCDGTQWKLQIRKGKTCVRNIYGSNDFPEEWGIFQKFLSDCLDLNEVKGTGTFSIVKRTRRTCL